MWDDLKKNLQELFFSISSAKTNNMLTMKVTEKI